MSSQEILHFISQNIKDHGKELDFDKLERLKKACIVIESQGILELKKIRIATKGINEAAKICNTVLHNAEKSHLRALTGKVSEKKSDVDRLCHLLATLTPRMPPQEQDEVISLLSISVMKSILHLDSEVIQALGKQMSERLYKSK